MSSHVVTSFASSYAISETEKGWLLKIQNEHLFGHVRIFRSATDARLAV
jgi:hypothetical protein